jgi:uncharacterized alkaline shock family protein YloU
VTTAAVTNGAAETREDQVTTETVGGEMTIGEGVLEKIAGLAAREIDGAYALGKAGLRGAIAGVAGAVTRGGQPDRGVQAEHGKREAAFDLEVILEYGTNFPSVVGAVRQRIFERIREMTDLQTVEVDVSILDIHIEGEEEVTGRELE